MFSRGLKTSASSLAGTLPLVEELSPTPDVMEALSAFADDPGVVLFESALKRKHLGRYSFLTADPFEKFALQEANLGDDPFAVLRRVCEKFPCEPVNELPPFQGGAAGLLSYELGQAWEKIPTPEYNEFHLPAMTVGLYDWVIAWDHKTEQAWIISQGFPETDLQKRLDRAEKRLQWVREKLGTRNSELGTRKTDRKKDSFRVPHSAFRAPDSLAPQFPASALNGLTSNFSRDDYLKAVERVRDYIHAGDIFQANLSQRLLYPLREHPVELYERLRSVNPAPFAGYFACDDWAVVSASPERFVCVHDGEIETRPIKGTRRRGSGPEADLYTRDELRESGKDQAENVMIVDLLRNDLSRVCEPGSIHVSQLCAVETYETVQHLVSEIRGKVSRNSSVWDIFQATFPGGSITGAPKIRAMEIIAELEPTARGPYCGSLFYAGFDGSVDSNILIRTFTCRNGWIQCSVGGGIVAQSDPVAEYEETLHKAEGMLRALR